MVCGSSDGAVADGAVFEPREKGAAFPFTGAVGGCGIGRLPIGESGGGVWGVAMVFMHPFADLALFCTIDDLGFAAKLHVKFEGFFSSKDKQEGMLASR